MQMLDYRETNNFLGDTNFELVYDDQVGNDGELIHFVMLVDFEPLYDKAALKNQAWNEAMIE